jgi:hypothetical protein
MPCCSCLRRLMLTMNPCFFADECLGVECPEVSECPADSYRLPSLVDPHPGCCPPLAKCQCNPGLLCPPPQCPSGWSKNLVLRNGTGLPGNCCPLYECVQDKGELGLCSFRPPPRTLVWTSLFKLLHAKRVLLALSERLESPFLPFVDIKVGYVFSARTQVGMNKYEI